MPPRGELSDEAAVNVVSYILWENEFPMGDAELKIPDMRSIQIEHKNGPQPLPNFALVEVVGCLTQIDGENWSLTNASDPVRTRKVVKLTPTELKDAESRQLGNQTFPLLGWRMLGAFNRDAHVGYKMHAKGVLMQQQGTLRLSLTTLDSLSTSCVDLIRGQ
jgi:hypothetical protein